jgi:hypothetical protein
MYTTLFILIFLGTTLFFVASDQVKAESKPQWLRKMAGKPVYARTLGTLVFLACWAAIAYLQGPGSGTFAMVGYLMASYSLLVLLRPLRYVNTVRLVVVTAAALLLETVIF